MHLFHIKNGQLLSNVPGCTTIEDVRLKTGVRDLHLDFERPDLDLAPHKGEEIVVVTDSSDIFYLVREETMVSTAAGDKHHGEILLFYACDEDHERKTAIVAVSARDTMAQNGWRIVLSKQWGQVGHEDCLVRRFPSLAAAQRA